MTDDRDAARAQAVATSFDEFFEQGDGEEPQAFADFLAGKTGKKVVGLSEDGAVEGRSEAEIRADMEDTDRELRAVDALVAGEDPDEVERKWPSR